MSSRMLFDELGGVMHHYTSEGNENGLPLVFINSLGCDMRIWHDVVRYFTDRYRVIRYDKRGHGLSDAPDGPYTIAQMAGDLNELLDLLVIDRAVIVGLSVGGVIAQQFALKYPNRVQALVLCDTKSYFGPPEFWTERAERVRREGLAAAAPDIVQRWFAPDYAKTRPWTYQGYTHMLARQPAEGYAATCEALRDVDLRSEVARIKARTLVVCGEEDVSTPLNAVRDFAATLPDARFEPIPGAGHTVCVEQPRTLATLIEQFLSGAG